MASWAYILFYSSAEGRQSVFALGHAQILNCKLPTLCTLKYQPLNPKFQPLSPKSGHVCIPILYHARTRMRTQSRTPGSGLRVEGRSQAFSDVIGALVCVMYWTLGWIRIPDLAW